MNDELIKREALIKRIDIELDHEYWDDSTTEVLLDCRAEILRLTEAVKESQALCLKFAQDRETQDAENESLRDQNTALDEKLAEYSERKYVPMTDDEIEQLPIYWLLEDQSVSVRRVEAEVIRRAGLVVDND